MKDYSKKNKESADWHDLKFAGFDLPWYLPFFVQILTNTAFIILSKRFEICQSLYHMIGN